MGKTRIRIVKRDGCAKWKKALMYIIAIIVALGIGAILLSSLDVNPFQYYEKMFTMGMVDNRIAYKTVENYIKAFVPLLITAVALSLSFKIRFWNIGGEGQFIVGAITAATIAFTCGGSLGTGLTIVLMLLAAMLAAGIYGGVIALLKVKFKTNETLLTLMFNYIALYFLLYLGETKAPWNFFLNPESERPIFGSFSELVSFPTIMIGKFSLNLTLIFAIILCIIIYIYLKRTKQGYEISVVGDSTGTAKYAGMKVSKIVLRTVFISAALIGLAGALKVGTSGILSTSITDSVGWTGIIVAWLAKLNTIGIFVVAALICVLDTGSTIASSTYSAIDANFADILQGIILFSVLVADFCTRFKIVISKEEDQ